MNDKEIDVLAINETRMDDSVPIESTAIQGYKEIDVLAINETRMDDSVPIESIAIQGYVY
jgi:exonuclease III